MIKTIRNKTVHTETILLSREEVPEPPAGATCNYGGVPPYKNQGYVLDAGNRRWRYANQHLVCYYEYNPRDPLSPYPVWARAWFAPDAP